MIDSVLQYIDSWLPAGCPGWASDLFYTALIAPVAILTYFLAKWLLVAVEKVVSRSATEWDDDLLNNSMLRALAMLAPALSVNALLPRVFDDTPGLHSWIKILTSIYILWTIVRIVTIFLNNLYNGLARRENTRPYAIKGIFQMLKLVAIGLGIIICLSIIIQRQPTAILTAIGASAAVLMLVFKDTILGLVASIQLSANKMVHRGDWIVADKHNANGEVVDVSLTTVKVRNWDNSISTIPPYSLVSESFRNYQAMVESGARRIERSILIDLSSVRYCTPEELNDLKERGFLDGLDIEDPGRVVNLYILRRWLEHFLATDKRVNTSMIYMVRQMEPTATGLPLQLYFFTHITSWKAFERVQSDIMDHVYAVVNTFGLTLFQSPAGTDLTRLAKR